MSNYICPVIPNGCRDVRAFVGVDGAIQESKAPFTLRLILAAVQREAWHLPTIIGGALPRQFVRWRRDDPRHCCQATAENHLSNAQFLGFRWLGIRDDMAAAFAVGEQQIIYFQGFHLRESRHQLSYQRLPG